MKTRLDRFMEKVNKGADDKDCCWVWTGTTNGHGYGQFWNGTRNIPAHHFLLSKIVPPGMQACHKCDNRTCVRSDHIFIGTRSDNMADCSQKGRLRFENGIRATKGKRTTWYRGASNHASKLREEDVAVIKSVKPRYGLGAAFARHFGVSESVVSGIWKNKRWAHVQPDEAARSRCEFILKTLGLWK